MMNTKIVTSAEEILKIEALCFEQGMPVAALMEKAALKMARFIQKKFPKTKFPNVGILAGTGHNGGDALVIARELLLAGYNVLVHVAGSNLKELTRQHLNYFKACGGRVIHELAALKRCSLYIDGLFGVGLNKNLELQHVEMIHFLNSGKAPVVAIDVPSGLHANTGLSMGACVQATHTLCLGFYKYGLLQDHAVDSVGKLHLLDLGFPSAIVQKGILQTPTQALTPQTLKSLFPLKPHKLKASAHKYSRGTTLLMCGSSDYPGAALLACLGSLAAGSGYVQLLSDKNVQQSILKVCPEVVVTGSSALQTVLKKQMKNPHFSILYGSGHTQKNGLLALLDHIEALSPRSFPTLIIDAEGLYEVREHAERFKQYKGEKILTPHSGEFKTLCPDIHALFQLDKKTNAIHKFLAVQKAANVFQSTVILKGPHTAIGTAHGECYVNIRSTPALAKAGTGDVLAGFIAGLAARGIPSVAAACYGVVHHSEAALRLEKDGGKNRVTPKNLTCELTRFAL